jgi:DNA polymerase-3 subunit delta
VYVIHGSEDFLCTEELHRLIRELLGDEPDSMALAEFDGETAEIAAVLDECRTPSLLAPLRMVIVRDADEFVGRPRFEGKSSYRELLEKYVSAPSTTGVLILVCRTWSKATRLYKMVDKVGRNIACEPPKGQAVAGWLTKRAKEAYRCTLDGMAARRLSELVGAHLGLLDMELGKLATYIAPRMTITTTDVDALVGSSREEKVFKITDAVGRKDAREALAVWQQVLATDRAAPYRAVGGLAYGFRRLLEAKQLVARGTGLGDVCTRLRLFTDAGTLKRQLDRFDLRQWQGHVRELLHIDIGSKTGLGSVEVAVEKFIVGLCQ